MRLLDPHSAQVLFIDHQPGFALSAGGADIAAFKRTVAATARLAKLLELPVTLTTLASEVFGGPVYPELAREFPRHVVIDRSAINAWDDDRVQLELGAHPHRRQVIVSGLWTGSSVAMTVLSALNARAWDEAFIIDDACMDRHARDHDLALRRMTAAGAQPLSWLQAACELYRDWGARLSNDAFADLIHEYGGAVGAAFEFLDVAKHHAPPREASGPVMPPPMTIPWR